MRIAEQRNTLGIHGFNGSQCRFKALFSLMWQAIDQVQVDRLEAGFSRMRHQISDMSRTLHPVDGLLYVVIDILHTNTQALVAQICQSGQIDFIDMARINFNAALSIDLKRKGLL